MTRNAKPSTRGPKSRPLPRLQLLHRHPNLHRAKQNRTKTENKQQGPLITCKRVSVTAIDVVIIQLSQTDPHQPVKPPELQFPVAVAGGYIRVLDGGEGCGESTPLLPGYARRDEIQMRLLGDEEVAWVADAVMVRSQEAQRGFSHGFCMAAAAIVEEMLGPEGVPEQV